LGRTEGIPIRPVLANAVHVRSTERHRTPFTLSELMRFGLVAGQGALCTPSRALPSNTSNNALAITRTKKYVTSAGGAAPWRRSSTRIARNASGNETTQMMATRMNQVRIADRVRKRRRRESTVANP